MNCLVWSPERYSGTVEQWPLVLFLHGAGECGDDLEVVKKYGLPKRLEDGGRFPFIVVAPQCRCHGWDPEVLTRLLDQVMAHYAVDRERVYVTGLSMGGYGTWALAAACPDRFAAAVPICGGGDPRWAEQLKDLPIWVFHGAKDDTVPLSASEEMVHALESAGGNVQFTVYPNAGHDCWTETYDNPRLYQWLLAQRRQSARPYLGSATSADWCGRNYHHYNPLCTKRPHPACLDGEAGWQAIRATRASPFSLCLAAAYGGGQAKGGLFLDLHP
ncbi:MAG: prolyl oligopeptidase family serine peptidase [Thermoguttaceae bacterium]